MVYQRKFWSHSWCFCHSESHLFTYHKLWTQAFAAERKRTNKSINTREIKILSLVQAIKLKHDSKKQRDLTASIQHVGQNGLLDFLTNLQDESLVIIVLARARRRAQLTILSLSGNTSSNCKMCSTFPCFTPTIREEKCYLSRYIRHITLEFVLNKNKNKNKREKTNKKPPPPPTFPNQSNKKHS